MLIIGGHQIKQVLEMLFYTILIVASLATPVIASSCITVPTPEDANAARSQVSLFNRDVLLTVSQRTPFSGIDKTDPEKITQILANLTFPWKAATIPYLFEINFPQAKKDTILKAMKYWESVSCVTFRTADPVQDYEFLSIIAADGNNGCYANLGMVQEGSFITNVNVQGCDSFAIATDLLAHALGVYDTGAATADKPTIATIAAVNELYKCAGACPTPPISCLNGGSPSGKSCSSCVCSSGWSGAKCDETSAGTQLVQVADTRDVTLALTGPFTVTEEKVIIVQAPAGKRLQATVKSFGPNCFTACTVVGLEISGSTGDKSICSLSATPPAVVSTENSLTLRLYRSANYPVQSVISLTVV